MEKGDLVILERISLTKHFTKEKSVQLADYLDPELITFLDVDDQHQGLTALVDLLDEKEKLQDKEAFFQAILNREKIVSTGIGIGVAIPHAKLSGYEDFFIAIGMQQGKGIEWHALDGLPVHAIFMIGGPEDKQAEYLNILSMITAAIKEEAHRKALFSAKTANEVIDLFEDL